MSDVYNQAEFISIQVCDPITITDENGAYTRYTVKTEVSFFTRYALFRLLSLNTKLKSSKYLEDTASLNHYVNC